MAVIGISLVRLICHFHVGRKAGLISADPFFPVFKVFIIIIDFLLFLSDPPFLFHLFLFLLPPPFLDLAIEFPLHLHPLPLDFHLFLVVELFGEEPPIVTSLLQVLYFLFIKHYLFIIISHQCIFSILLALPQVLSSTAFF